MKTRSKITEEAAQWLVRLEEDSRPECRQAFAEWIRHSPHHLQEFLLVEASYSKLSGLDPYRQIDVRKRLALQSAEIVALPGWDISRPVRKRWAWGLASVAALAAVSVLGWMVIHPVDNSQTYTTQIGEQRSFSLADGSVIHLNARSQVEVDYSMQARQIRMLEGQALFVVARDPSRPFRVATDTAVVQAVGTQFDVYRRKDHTTVSVIEGQVQLFAQDIREQTLDVQHPPTMLTAGEEAQITPGRIVKRTTSDPAKPIAWRQRQMVFRSDTLAEIVEQANRYSRVQIKISDPAIASRRLSGVFNVDDLDSLMAFLNAGGDLSFDHDVAGETITIRADE